ncbi:MAG: hypothetical protein ACR2NY_04505 [Alphaproteobacteria bacterium]
MMRIFILLVLLSIVFSSKNATAHDHHATARETDQTLKKQTQ